MGDAAAAGGKDGLEPFEGNIQVNRSFCFKPNGQIAHRVPR